MQKSPISRIIGSGEASTNTSTNTSGNTNRGIMGTLLGADSRKHPQSKSTLPHVPSTTVINKVTATTNGIIQGASSTAGMIANGANNVATTVINGASNAATTVFDSATGAAGNIINGATAAVDKVTHLIKQNSPHNQRDKSLTLLGQYDFNYDGKHAISLKLDAVKRELMGEFWTKQIETYQDPAIRTWEPEDSKVNELIGTFIEAQDLMCKQLFTEFTSLEYNKSNHELAQQYIDLKNGIDLVLEASKPDISHFITNNKLDANDIHQNFNTYTEEITLLYQSSIHILESAAHTIKETRQLNENSRVFLDIQIKSIDINLSELSEFISDIQSEIQEELNDKNPELYLYQHKLDIYRNQHKLLEDINIILKQIISRSEDPMSHCISPEQFFFIRDNQRTPHIIEQKQINKRITDIAHDMITVSPGIERINQKADSIVETMVSTLLESAVNSMRPFIEKMSNDIEDGETHIQKITYRLASNLTIIKKLHNRVPILSIAGNIHLKGEQLDIEILLREGKDHDEMAFKKASQQFNELLSPIKIKTERFLLSLVDEINHKINGVNETTPGFMSAPTDILANEIVEKLKCFNIVMPAFKDQFPNSLAIENIMPFNVNGENFSNVNAVIEKIFDRFTKSITHHMNTSTLDKPENQLKTSVKGYTSLLQACKTHAVYHKPKVLDIQQSAIDIKNRYIQKLKLTEYTNAFMLMQRIVEYSDLFYQHVSHHLKIKWISKEELLMEMIEAFVENTSYLSQKAKESLHREIHIVIKNLLGFDHPQFKLFCQIFPVIPAEHTPGELLNAESLPTGIYLEQYSDEALYLNIIQLVIKNNPHIHKINAKEGLSPILILKSLASLHDQIDTYIFNGVFSIRAEQLGKIITSNPGIILEIAARINDKLDNRVETHVKRNRPTIGKNTPTVIITEEIDDDGNKQNELIPSPDSSGTHSDNNNNFRSQLKDKGKNAVETLKSKALTVRDKVKDEYSNFNSNKISYIKHTFLYEPSQNSVSDGNNTGLEEDEIISDEDISVYVKEAERKVKAVLHDEQDKVIYNTLIKHHMNPKAAYDELIGIIDFNSFNSTAKRLLILSPSTLFIAGMSRLSLENDNITHALFWADHLKDVDCKAFIRLSYQIMTTNINEEHRSKLVSVAEKLIQSVSMQPYNLTPSDYVKLINKILDINGQGGAIVDNTTLLSLIEAYLKSRDCLYDYDDIGSINEHYDLLIKLNSKLTSSQYDSHESKTLIIMQAEAFELILKSQAYGTVLSTMALRNTLANAPESLSSYDVRGTLKKVEDFNQRILKHIETQLNNPGFLIEDQTVFHHKMLVLMRNTIVESSISPLHMDHLDEQYLVNRSFFKGVELYLLGFKEDINFTEQVSSYIAHLSTISIKEDEMIKLINAVKKLSLANLRNLESSIILIIEMISQQFKKPTNLLLLSIMQFKEKVVQLELINAMNSILIHFNSELLSESDAQSIKSTAINIMNSQDRKSLPANLYNITHCYRTELSRGKHHSSELTKIRLEIDFIIWFCDQTMDLSENAYEYKQRELTINAAHVGMGFGNNINERLAPLIDRLSVKSSKTDTHTLKVKMQEMYSRLVEIYVIETLPHLDDQADFIIIKNMLESLKDKKSSVQKILYDARTLSNAASGYTHLNCLSKERPISTLLKALSAEMLSHVNNYSIDMLLRSVTKHIHKPAVNLHFII